MDLRFWIASPAFSGLPVIPFVAPLKRIDIRAIGKSIGSLPTPNQVREIPSVRSENGLSIILNKFLWEVLGMNTKEGAKAAGAAAAGAAAGYGAVASAGVTAVGMVGGGAGFGAAAGPVGAAVGALAGLAAYGVYRAFKG